MGRVIRGFLNWWREEQRRRRALDVARDMEGDATIGAGAGFGMYTKDVAERRRGRSNVRVIPSDGHAFEPYEVSAKPFLADYCKHCAWHREVHVSKERA